MAIVALMATVVSSFVANTVGPVRTMAFPSLLPVVLPVLADTARYDGIDAKLAKLEAKLDVIEARFDYVDAKLNALERTVRFTAWLAEDQLCSTTAALIAAILATCLTNGMRYGGRALTANMLCDIARKTAYTFAGFFVSWLALLKFGSGGSVEASGGPRPSCLR